MGSFLIFATSIYHLCPSIASRGGGGGGTHKVFRNVSAQEFVRSSSSNRIWDYEIHYPTQGDTFVVAPFLLSLSYRDYGIYSFIFPPTLRRVERERRPKTAQKNGRMKRGI